MKIIYSNRILKYFMPIVACVWIILLFITPAIQLEVFFLRVGDFWADFFNTLIYVADKDPYFNELNGTLNKNYLPFSYMILYPFTKLTNYSGKTLLDCWTDGIALVSGFLFMLFSLFLLFHSLYLLCKDLRLNKVILFVVFFSAANLYALERGNEIVISAACVNYFIFFRSHKHCQWIAIICLAIASVLKVFPVVFSLYYLRTRSYKLMFYYIIITFLLAILPFLFFERGFYNIEQLYNNVVAQTASYGYDSSVYRFGIIPLLLQIDEKLDLQHKQMFYYIGKYLTYFLGLYTLFLYFKTRSSIIGIALLSMFCCLFPQQAFAYNVIYLFPVFIGLQFNSAQLLFGTKNICIATVLFAIVFCPIQVSHSMHITMTEINNIATILFWLLLLAFATRQMLANNKQYDT